MRIRNYFRALNVLILLSIIGWVIVDGRALNYVERSAPTIEWLAVPESIGKNGKKLALKVLDDGAGIKDVSLTVSLKGAEKHTSKVVFEEIYTGDDISDSRTISFVLDPSRYALAEGRYELLAVARDSSLWTNKLIEAREFEVDLRPPQLQVISRHHYGKQGGTLAVIYGLAEEGVAASGVRLGEKLYSGYQIDASIGVPSKTFLALVPVKDDYSLEKDGEFEAIAEDAAGNVAVVGFNQNIKAVPLRSDTLQLSRNFFLKVLPHLAPALDSKLAYSDWRQLETGALAEIFKRVNQELRQANLLRILDLAKDVRFTSLPSVFMKPMPAKLTASFAERRQYFLEDLDLGKSVHEGYDLASLERAPVYSAAAGSVLYAGELGIYGNAVILDHGYGLVSLYGHLSSLSVEKGASLAKGALIGNTGATGLAGGDHLHFEVRVHGQAVDPREWLDAHWVDTRIVEPLGALIGQKNASSE